VLFLVPVIILEPVKPVGAYLIATNHLVSGVSLIAIGELLKIVIVERLFGCQPRQADVDSRIRAGLQLGRGLAGIFPVPADLAGNVAASHSNQSDGRPHPKRFKAWIDSVVR
jgi:hypothetical protein